MNPTPTHAVPIVLIGATRRAEIVRRLTEAATMWRDRWSTQAAGISVEIVKSPTEPTEGGRSATHIYVSAVDRLQSRLALLQVSGDLGAALLGLSTAGGAGLDVGSAAVRVDQEVAQSLMQLMMNAAHIIDYSINSSTEKPPAEGRARNWLALTLHLNRQSIPLWLHMSLVEKLVPPARATSTPPLTRRRDGIAPASLRVNALLGEAEVSLPELLALEPGHVIVLNEKLTQSGQLLTEDGRRVASIVVGRAGSQRAVSLA